MAESVAEMPKQKSQEELRLAQEIADIEEEIADAAGDTDRVKNLRAQKELLEEKLADEETKENTT